MVKPPYEGNKVSKLWNLLEPRRSMRKGGNYRICSEQGKDKTTPATILFMITKI